MAGVDAAFWVDVVWKVIMLGLMVWAALKRGDAALLTKIEALEKELEETNQKVTKLSTELEGRPGIRDFKAVYEKLDNEVGRLHEKINKVATDFAQQAGKIDGMDTLIKVIHQEIIRERK
jgi:peptidoglycan hydrolase CwlO-like protein